MQLDRAAISAPEQVGPIAVLDRRLASKDATSTQPDGRCDAGALRHTERSIANHDMVRRAMHLTPEVPLVDLRPTCLCRLPSAPQSCKIAPPSSVTSFCGQWRPSLSTVHVCRTILASLNAEIAALRLTCTLGLANEVTLCLPACPPSSCLSLCVYLLSAQPPYSIPLTRTAWWQSYRWVAALRHGGCTASSS